MFNDGDWQFAEPAEEMKADRIKCRQILRKFEPEIQQKATEADSLGKPYLIIVNGSLDDRVQVGIMDWDDADEIFQAECPKEWANMKRAREHYPDALVAVCQCRTSVVFKIMFEGYKDEDFKDED